MNQRIRWLLLSLALALALPALLLPHLALGQDEGQIPLVRQKMDDGLVTVLKEVEPDQSVRYILFFDKKANLAPESLSQDESARRREIVTRLQETADHSQASVLSQLAAMEAEGQVSRFRQLWIINGIAVQGTASSVQKLATHPDILNIQLDEASHHFEPNSTVEEHMAQDLALGSAWGVGKIGAGVVWDGLGIRGEGSTVAIVDSGVDMEHPDLFPNYRGNKGGGQLVHEENWFYDGVVTSTMPADTYGHGTHVAGTAVGQNGTGVAPGAKWIAAAISDRYGLIFDSYVHAAFQWLLAPGGNSEAAPDVANNSWGGPGGLDRFLEDVQILHQAGIVMVFSSGNEGPAQGSVQSPGSYPHVITVGASDDEDKPAWFSGRGPSPLTSEIKPLLLAPGTQILSSMPGEKYAPLSGTSMAAPHVSGAIALLLAADPSLTRTEVREVLAETAVSITSDHPNYDSGWGRLDAYSAVVSQMPHGRLYGTVTHNSQPVPKVFISISGTDGFELTGSSDENGAYEFLLPPGSYSLHISAFAFHEKQISGLDMENGEDKLANIPLQQKPMGKLSGKINDTNGHPISASIAIEDTPKSIKSNEDGHFSLWVPAGSYEMRVQAAGYRSQRIPAAVKANDETVVDLTLNEGPNILFIDSGQERFNSARETYQTAIIDAGFSSDTWILDEPFTALPQQAVLANYDVLIWSSTSNSPGEFSAGDELTTYLREGGNLLISGRDVARQDGRQGLELSWFHNYLEGRYMGEIDEEEAGLPLTGLKDSSFAGLELALNQEDSDAYQIRPDQMEPRKDSLTKPVLQYAGGGAAGLESGICKPFRMIQLGFGLEGVSGADKRAAIIERSIDALLAPREPLGVRWIPDNQQEFTLPGETYYYELNIQNMGEIITDTFDLHVEPHQWATSLVTPTLELGPCAVGQTILAVEIPPDAELDVNSDMKVTAVSRSDNKIKAVFTMEQKTPGNMLLVDDDRFYQRGTVYQDTLDNLGYSYDVWETISDGRVRRGPTAKFLQAYETVVWFTGYDWFAPIEPEENAALEAYLAAGGHLFLSSQDYLFYNWDTPLTRQQLGILDYREVVTPTAVYAHPNFAHPSSLVGPIPLDFGPYQNFSDSIIPHESSLPFLWHNQGHVAAVASAGESGGRSVFFSFPFEALPEQERPVMMKSALGWLGSLGDSTFETSQRTVQAGEATAYTLTVRNNPKASFVTVAISNTLPEGLSLVPGTLEQGVRISADDRTLNWQGVLQAGKEKQIRYQATTPANLPADTRLENKVTILNLDNGKSFQKALPLWVNSPDLSRTTISAVRVTNLPERSHTYTLALHNTALSAAEELTAVLHLPDSLFVLTDTLQTSAGEAIVGNHDRIIWNGSLLDGEAVTTTIVLTQALLSESWLPTTAIIEDGLRDPIIIHELDYSPPEQIFLPIAAAP